MYSRIPFPVEIREVDDGSSSSIPPFEIEAFRTTHVDFDSIGYSIRDKKGYRVVVSGDTTPTKELRSKVAGSDLAVLEATFEDGNEVYAETYGHMTQSQALDIGKSARSLLLVHQMPMNYFLKMTCAKIATVESPQS